MRWTRARRRVGLARPWRREVLAGLYYNETIQGSEHRHVVATNLQLVQAVGKASQKKMSGRLPTSEMPWTQYVAPMGQKLAPHPK